MTELEREIFGQILGEKKMEIILFLAQNADENGFIAVKISDICERTDASKPTVTQTIKLLENRKIFERVKNGIYRFKNLKELEKK
nr:helix-turn-helix domain-containing protein [uncultured Campylobacter sp.]